MNMMMNEHGKVLRLLGADLTLTACLNHAATCAGSRTGSNISTATELAEAEFEARDAFEMAPLKATGFANIASGLLDRANPTAAWGSNLTSERRSSAFAANHSSQGWFR